MIGLVALLSVSQPLPGLDRNWINHQARREMLIAAGASSFDPALPLPILPKHRAAKPVLLLGGPSGM
jgi:hypothetical protein